MTAINKRDCQTGGEYKIKTWRENYMAIAGYQI